MLVGGLRQKEKALAFLLMSNVRIGMEASGECSVQLFKLARIPRGKCGG